MNVERTFRRNIHDFHRIYLEAEDGAHELFRRLKVENLEFRTIGIKIRFEHFETFTRERSLPDYSDRLEPILSTTASLLGEFENRSEPVRLLGVRASQLRTRRSDPSSLDSWVKS